MRLALDTLASRDNDIGAALGDFMFRWHTQLQAAGVESTWAVELPNHATALPPHAALQLLRIAQEALTNVLKHAQATRVQVQLAETDAGLELRVKDDGSGLPAPGVGHEGHGIGNMRARAERLGGTIDLYSATIATAGGGTCIVLRLPLRQAAAPVAGPPRAATVPAAQLA